MKDDTMIKAGKDSGAKTAVRFWLQIVALSALVLGTILCIRGVRSAGSSPRLGFEFGAQAEDAAASAALARYNSEIADAIAEYKAENARLHRQFISCIDSSGHSAFDAVRKTIPEKTKRFGEFKKIAVLTRDLALDTATGGTRLNDGITKDIGEIVVDPCTDALCKLQDACYEFSSSLEENRLRTAKRISAAAGALKFAAPKIAVNGDFGNGFKKSFVKTAEIAGTGAMLAISVPIDVACSRTIVVSNRHGVQSPSPLPGKVLPPVHEFRSLSV